MIGKTYEESLSLEAFDEASQELLAFLRGLTEEGLTSDLFFQNQGRHLFFPLTFFEQGVNLLMTLPHFNLTIKWIATKPYFSGFACGCQSICLYSNRILGLF